MYVTVFAPPPPLSARSANYYKNYNALNARTLLTEVAYLFLYWFRVENDICFIY